MTTGLYIAGGLAAVYLVFGLLLASYGASQGDGFRLRTVVVWPLVVLGR